jgi:hypothetical protein
VTKPSGVALLPDEFCVLVGAGKVPNGSSWDHVELIAEVRDRLDEQDGQEAATSVRAARAAVSAAAGSGQVSAIELSQRWRVGLRGRGVIS